MKEAQNTHDEHLASVLTAVGYLRDRLQARSRDSDGERWWSNAEWQRILREIVSVVITPDDQERLINPDTYLVQAIAAALDKMRVHRDTLEESDQVRVYWDAPVGTGWPEVRLRVRLAD